MPDRELIIVLAYGVVVVTLVVPGLTLAPLIRALGFGQREQHQRQEVEARMRLTHAALERFDELGEHGELPQQDIERLRDRNEARLERPRDRLEAAGGHPDHRTEAAEAQVEALEAERDVLAEMRRERAFPAELLRELEAEIDVDEAPQAVDVRRGLPGRGIYLSRPRSGPCRSSAPAPAPG